MAYFDKIELQKSGELNPIGIGTNFVLESGVDESSSDERELVAVTDSSNSAGIWEQVGTQTFLIGNIVGPEINHYPALRRAIEYRYQPGEPKFPSRAERLTMNVQKAVRVAKILLIA